MIKNIKLIKLIIKKCISKIQLLQVVIIQAVVLKILEICIMNFINKLTKNIYKDLNNFSHIYLNKIKN